MERVPAVLLAGGLVGDLPREEGDTANLKGMLRVAGHPLAWRTLQALRGARTISSRVLVGGDSSWQGVDVLVEAQPTLMGSFQAGVQACACERQPVLVCCGDLPLVTAEALDDFVRRCAWFPHASIWYGFIRQENSWRRFPAVSHTWARLQDGTFCGSGVMMLRPEVMQSMGAAMERLTHARKNMLKLAACLGLGNVLNYALGRLTVARAEKAGSRLFGVACVGVESPYAELGFNVDKPGDLAEARRILLEVGDPHAS